MLNEKGMVPKDKGWGMSNLGYGGKTHVLLPCCLSTSLMLQLVVGAVIAEVVVVVAGC